MKENQKAHIRKVFQRAKEQGRSFASIGIHEFDILLKELNTLQQYIVKLERLLPPDTLTQLQQTHQEIEARVEDNKTRILRIKEKSGCIDCGEREVKLLTFHHRNPEEKTFNLSGNMQLPWPILEAEIDKCELLCDPCHKLRHGLLTLIHY